MTPTRLPRCHETAARLSQVPRLMTHGLHRTEGCEGEDVLIAPWVLRMELTCSRGDIPPLSSHFLSSDCEPWLALGFCSLATLTRQDITATSAPCSSGAGIVTRRQQKRRSYGVLLRSAVSYKVWPCDASSDDLDRGRRRRLCSCL